VVVVEEEEEEEEERSDRRPSVLTGWGTEALEEGGERLQGGLTS
jgi:hypothetical protein